MNDAKLQYEVAQMRLLLDSPAWPVLVKYIEDLRQGALEYVLGPHTSDTETHRYRGEHIALGKVLSLPNRLIDMEKSTRA